jgi:hypothetical protein
MLVRLATAALLLSLLAAGCGGDRGPRRDAVAEYMRQVSAIQSRMEAPLAEVSRANQDFARGRTRDARKLQGRLAQSELTLRRLRTRLARVEPPADAKKLHALLLDLAGREATLAGEVEQLARFIPQFNAALGSIGPAGQALKTALSAQGDVPGKTLALEHYGDAVGVVLQRLRPLDPPPSSQPVFAAQVSTLRRVRAAVVELVAALREQRAKDIAPLLRRFDVAAVSNQTTAVQKAQIAAVKGYNARIRAFDDLAVAISRERARLQRTLG